MSALETQVGGGHYKALKIQPVEYAYANALPFIEGSVVKYVTRWRSKGGLRDLEKAKHFIEQLIELETAAAGDALPPLKPVSDKATRRIADEVLLAPTAPVLHQFIQGITPLTAAKLETLVADHGWSLWVGGTPPLPAAIVETLTRGGQLCAGCRSGELTWGQRPNPSTDIIAYKEIVK
jgi:hypothetical protein